MPKFQGKSFMPTNSSDHVNKETAEITVPVGELISQIPQPDDGFPTPALAEHWRLRGCGIACVRMILDAHHITGDSYWPLVNEGLERGAYCDRGWIHQGLIEMLGRRGVAGQAVRGGSLDDICQEIDTRKLVIASVTVCFRGGQPNSSGEGHYAPGGHLVLVTGTRRTHDGRSEFRVHHPSATEANNLANYWVEPEAMAASFSGNYLVFDGPGSSTGVS